MSGIDFLRDKFGYLGASAIGIGCTALFLYLLRYDAQATLFVVILLAAAFSVPLAAEYGKKRGFYRDVMRLSESLDKKYLLTGIVERPSFLEGALLYDVLCAAGKAMNDEAAAVRRDRKEYREYVELWVHEVKTPIASTRLLIENHPSAVTASIGEELDRIEAYLEQALYYARAGTLEKDYIVKRVPLADVVRAAVRRNSRQLIAARVAVRLNALEAEVETDEKWLEFILNQLIVNAVKYRRAEAGAALCIEARALPQSVVLTVADNGIGMSEADAARAFDRGYTGAAGRAYAKSTGMGLYLCRQLCEKMGLSIGLTSRAQEGTTVRIVFPRGSLTNL